jgi:dTDP-4-dehydrorhamnose 3,5-epimerase-like enzyme
LKSTRISNCHNLSFSRFIDSKGRLDVIEGIKGINNETIKFNRTYILRDFKNKTRGVHAHKNLYQLFLTFNGKFTLKIFDGFENEEVTLDDGSAFLVVPGIWRELNNFSNKPIIVVLASELYDPDDYIHDLHEFESYKKN